MDLKTLIIELLEKADEEALRLIYVYISNLI